MIHQPHLAQSPNSSSFVRFMACVHGPEERLGPQTWGGVEGERENCLDQPGGG